MIDFLPSPTANLERCGTTPGQLMKRGGPARQDGRFGVSSRTLRRIAAQSGLGKVVAESRRTAYEYSALG